MPTGLHRLGILVILTGTAACEDASTVDVNVQGGDTGRGRQALTRLECGACHAIPGIRNSPGRLGPPLHDYRERVYIAGRFANEPEMLVRWIRDAPALDPATAMPNLGVSEQQARDIAAYLYSR